MTHLSTFTLAAGYLVLVDIDATGHVSQIFPSAASLARAPNAKASSNFVQPGAPMQVPDSRNPSAQFIFKAEEPRGTGMIVALLSQRPVQMIQLPETSTTHDPQAAVDALGRNVRALTATGAEDGAAAAWSIAARTYLIK